MKFSSKQLWLLFGVTGIALIGALAGHRLWRAGGSAERAGASRAAPVAVAPIERGAINLQRSFSGTLEAQSEFVVSSKVGGQIELLAVDIADPVERGQLVAQLDDAEFVQAVAQAEAELTVAQANLAQARSASEIAARDAERTETLWDRGLTSESQLEVSQAERLARGAQLEVAKAHVARAEAALESARIRLGYTTVIANWAGGDDRRVVAERYIDAGQTVGANEPLLLIVELDPILAVIYVTERDYARLSPGQPVQLTSDGRPGEVFTGEIARIAPIFQESTRQARVEVVLQNQNRWLKPGMFVRATIALDRVENATLVPEEALAIRGDQDGVFIVDEESQTVSWHPVTVGIRQGGRVQVVGEALHGRVVTLGQQLVDDGSLITIPEDEVNRISHRGAD